MGMMLEVSSEVIATLVGEAARAAPAECCGLLLGDDVVRVVRAARNVAADPLRHFEIDPVVLLAAHREARTGGLRVLGYYHSHPNGHPAPSAVDCEHASGDRRVWAIVADGAVTFWRDDGHAFTPLSYRVHDG